jgi:hypothetical protein
VRHGYAVRWLMIGLEELDGATGGNTTYNPAWANKLSIVRDHLIAGDAWE